jgi:hypothetical protein
MEGENLIKNLLYPHLPSRGVEKAAQGFWQKNFLWFPLP